MVGARRQSILHPPHNPPSHDRRRQVLPAEVRVEGLMAAAARLFIDKGIEATTVSEIVERAGVAKGTFYHYFAAKEDVVLALRHRFTRDFLSRVDEVIAGCPPDDHEARVEAWLQAFVEAYIANYELHDVVFHDFRPERRQSPDKNAVIDQLSTVLADGQRAGAWTLPDLRMTAILLYDGMHGAVDDSIADGKADATRLCQSLVILFKRILSS